MAETLIGYIYERYESGEFKILSTELRNISPKIPSTWGNIQNDATDSQLKMFNIHDYDSLENNILNLSEESKKYFRRRWFLWKCAACDEFLFNFNDNVRLNPNHRDQEFDIEFNNERNLRFDIKGTVVPKKFRTNFSIDDFEPQKLVDFFYQEQSTGVRSHYQNRIFIVHHSLVDKNREMLVRCSWQYKYHLYKEYALRVQTDSKFLNYKNLKIDLIVLLEKSDGSLMHKYFCQ